MENVKITLTREQAVSLKALIKASLIIFRMQDMDEREMIILGSTLSVITKALDEKTNNKDRVDNSRCGCSCVSDADTKGR